jgi:transposase
MPVAGGLDIYRKQLTFGYLDTAAGEVPRGQITPAAAPAVRAGAVRRPGRRRVRAGGGAPAGGTSRRSRPGPASPAAASGTPGPARPAPGICGSCRRRAGCRSAGSRRPASGSAGRCWRPIPAGGPGTPPGRGGAVFCRQGAPALGDGALRTGRDLGALRAAAAVHLAPAGQPQVAAAVAVLGALEARREAVRHRLPAAARSLPGAGVLAERRYRAGPVTGLAMTWLGGAGRFCSSRTAVRFAGPGASPPGPRAARARPGGCPGRARAVLRWAVDAAGQTRPPRPGPRPRLPRRGHGPPGRPARRPARGPQDPPPGLPHPGRARRRRGHCRLSPASRFPWRPILTRPAGPAGPDSPGGA